MVFHRGGVLDRLFADSDLGPALEHVRVAMREGAAAFSGDSAVLEVLAQIGGDVDALRLRTEAGLPGFELGGVSERELLQTLRLALPVLPEILIPLRRQGRGVQRLLLVASLLRLAARDHQAAPIAAFEEPEEALEPLRQAQIAGMIAGVADQGGQVFVVTHSVDIARSFAVDDIHLVADEPRGNALSLRDRLSGQAKQAYERRLDGAVVLGLFARVPVLVEGPGDRALLEHPADELARAGQSI
jgi:putative ATP-dependent endonuclease of the OLD family